MKKKMRILITGSKGFIGSNLKINLEANRQDYDIVTLRHSSSESTINKKIKDIDFIFHLAGVNRSDSLIDFDNNFLFVKKICNAIKNYGLKLTFVYASTYLIDKNLKNNSKIHKKYISSKIKAEKILKEFQNRTASNVFIYRLPHIMGKWAKPNYNSVIATFCYNIANNKRISLLNEKNSLSIIQIDDLVNEFIGLTKKKYKQGFYFKYLKHKSISVKNLYNKLTEFNFLINNNYTPNFKNNFDRKIYSTFISYLPKERLSYALKNNSDYRGNFVECLKNNNFGQISYFTSEPKISRGNHYHHLKCEIFIVVQGKALYESKSLKNGKINRFNINDKDNRVVRTVPGEIHSIKNIGKNKLIVILWSNEIFDNNRPDTFFE